LQRLLQSSTGHGFHGGHQEDGAEREQDTRQLRRTLDEVDDLRHAADETDPDTGHPERRPEDRVLGLGVHRTGLHEEGAHSEFQRDAQEGGHGNG
jgi:hypothetical protein